MIHQYSISTITSDNA